MFSLLFFVSTCCISHCLVSLQASTGLSLIDYAAAANALVKEGTMDSIVLEPKMTILDFAGQRMYYHMHHLFITEQLSIYLKQYETYQ